MITKDTVLLLSVIGGMFLVLLLILGVIAHRLREMIETYNSLRAEVKDMATVIHHTQQARMAAARRSDPQPGVDAHGRTVRRDTYDLPGTGRIRQGLHFERKGGNASPDTDG